MIKQISLLLILLFVAGCNAMPDRDPAFAPVEPDNLKPPPQQTGSIYQAGYDVRLFEDHVARRVGDILTIRLAESTSATKNTDMNIDKENDTALDVPTLFGTQNAKILGLSMEQSLKSKNKFKAKGKGKQNNRLNGTLSVTVVEVLPNGNLRIRGEKRLSMTGGAEYVRLSGIVRPVDIDTSNGIDSTQVADATIMYVGDGPMNEAAEIGWLARFFNSKYFPF